MTSKFKEHKLRTKEIEALNKLVISMKKRSKVRPKKVVCLALGSLLGYDRDTRKRSLEQFAVLSELLSCLGMILNLAFSQCWRGNATKNGDANGQPQEYQAQQPKSFKTLSLHREMCDSSRNTTSK